MGKRVVKNARARNKYGEAGRDNASARSDLFVSVEGNDSGELSIDLESKVEVLYGHSILRSVREGLSSFGFVSGTVKIRDRGGVPFVIRARLETALRRAGYAGDPLVRKQRSHKKSSAKDRLRRSRLYLPGNEPKFMLNAGLHGPDAVILDLEDSVHIDAKDAARLIVRNALIEVDFMGSERMVRINQLPHGLDDLDAIIPSNPDMILLPKIESATAIKAVEKRIRKIQKTIGIERDVWLMPIIESALGVENAFDIASASPSVAALTIGLEDYTADLGVPKTRIGDESLYARMRIVNTAVASGVQAIDSVFGDVGDSEGLAAWANRSRGMGFSGMGCIHPRQIIPIHNAYAPSGDEIERALKIVDAFKRATDEGLSVVSLGSRMVDPPVVLRAQRLVAEAQRAGLIEGD